jgi:hypothetical protein
LAVEQVFVKALIAPAAVEPLPEAALHGLSERGAMPFGVPVRPPFPYGARGQLGSVAHREEALSGGYGRLRSPQVAQQVPMTGLHQFSRAVLQNPIDKETGRNSQSRATSGQRMPTTKTEVFSGCWILSDALTA